MSARREITSIKQSIDIQRLVKFNFLIDHIDILAILVYLFYSRDSDIRRCFELTGIQGSNAVDSTVNRIDCRTQFTDILTYILITEDIVVHTVEIGIERNQYILRFECLSSIKHPSLRCTTVLKVFKRLATTQIEQKMLLIVGKTEFAAISHNNVCRTVALTDIVYHHIIQMPVLGVLLLHENVISLNLVVKHTLWYFKFR